MASRLLPWRSTAERAPSSTTSVPRGCAVKPIQRFHAATVWPWATNSVPTSSPARMRRRVAGLLAAGDDHVFAGRGGQPGRFQFAGHAPFAQTGGFVADQRRRSNRRAERRWG